MSRLGVFTATVVFAVSGFPAIGAPRERNNAHFEADACMGSLADKGYRCGHVTVPEDWGRPAGRSLKLSVVVLPADGPQPNIPPLVYLVGGPGSPASEQAPLFERELHIYRQNRTIVLFDMRGTGTSNALHCPEAEPPIASIERAYDNPYHPGVMRRCRDQLSARADLRQYNTPAAVLDLEAVRRALGAPTIDLRAISYGTTYALAYMQAFPTHVHAAVLESTAAPADRSSTAFGPSAARALNMLFQRCKADVKCRAAYSNPRADLTETLQNIAHAGGFSARGGDPARMVRIRITPSQFLEELRGPLSVSVMARAIPAMLHDAARGDFQPFVDLTLPGKLHRNNLARGQFFSVNCTDAFYNGFDFERARVRQRRSLFGDYKLSTQEQVCALWPKKKLPHSFYRETRSSVPTLFFSGDLDPVTPPKWAARLASRFVHGRQVIVPGMGHIPATVGEVGCIAELETQFLAHPDPGAINASCARDLAFQPFD